MSLRIASVCSGIGGAELAFEGLGEHAFASEIDPFARAILRQRFPYIPLHGDFTAIGREHGPVDVLVGGTPCQSFSVAGLRGGMADARGNLALEFLRLAERLRARWVLWENVPGVLSSSDGRDFGAFVGGLAELGYGWAYRVLDAQFFGLAQRRKRVFVVGCLGDWRRAAAVLFEPASLRGHPAPGREARERAAATLSASPDRGGGNSEGQRLVAFDARQSDVISYGDQSGPLDTDGSSIAIARSLNAHPSRIDGESETFVAYDLTGTGPGVRNAGNATDVHTVLRSRAPGHSEGSTTTVIAHSLRADGFDASEDGTGRGTPLVVPLLEIGKGSPSRGIGPNGAGFGTDGDPMFTLQAGAQHGVAFTASAQSNAYAWERDIAPTLDATTPNDDRNIQKGVRIGSAVRRLTPTECERLQGYPDDWTAVEYRGRPAADGPRYRALGNAFAVPVVRWIARRIAAEAA